MIYAYVIELCYLMLMPAIPAVIFFASATALLLLAGKRKKRKPMGIVLISVVLLSGGYSMFNLFDCIRYRRTGLILSPFNQFFFEMFLPPADLHLPCVLLRLHSQPETISIRYRHRYGGPQRVEFRLVNDTPKKYPYSALTKLNISFEGKVICPDGSSRKFSKSLDEVHLLPGTNGFMLCGYEIATEDALGKEYEVQLKVTGDAYAVRECFPESNIAICNGTSE